MKTAALIVLACVLLVVGTIAAIATPPSDMRTLVVMNFSTGSLIITDPMPLIDCAQAAERFPAARGDIVTCAPRLDDLKFPRDCVVMHAEAHIRQFECAKDTP
jgi:hypothetical protein